MPDLDPLRLGVLLMLVATLAAAETIPAIPNLATAATIQLPPLRREAVRLQVDPQGPRLIGIGRALEPPLGLGSPDRPHWQTYPDGRHALTVRLVSPGALGVRLVHSSPQPNCSIPAIPCR